MLRYGALGSVEVTGESGPLPLGGGNQRRLLAVLLAHPNRFVAVETLAEAIWADAPPASEKHALQTVASRLRRALGAHGDDLVTGSEGYRLAVTSENCDLVGFEELIARASDEPPVAELGLYE